MKRRRPKPMRLAARLIYWFEVQEVEDTRPLFEVRIINFKATSARQATSYLRKYRKESEFSFRNDAGQKINFRCAGIDDIQELGGECHEEEVWYDIVQRKNPKNRKRALTMPEDVLRKKILEFFAKCEKPKSGSKARKK